SSRSTNRVPRDARGVLYSLVKENPMKTTSMALATLAFSSAVMLGGVLACAESKTTAAEEPNAVTAIDILLEPDATMIRHAEAANERLLKSFPKGFSLGKSHQPHISCLQRYVKTADLDKVYEAVGKILAEEKPTEWKLKAYKYYYIPGA